MHANDDIRLFAALSRIEALLQEANTMQRQWIAECRARDEQAIANQELSMQREQEARIRNESELRRHNEALLREYERGVRRRTDAHPDANTGQPS